MTNPLGRMTARDALVYAAGEEHGYCTVVAKGGVHNGKISFRCLCGTVYIVRATNANKDALRNILEDKKL
jgi:hypothetical protein